MRIIVADKIADDGIEYLRSKGFNVDTKFGISHDELLSIIEDYDAIIVRSATKVNAEILARAKKLKAVGRAGNGVDNIDVTECTKRGIVVVNTPEGNIMAAAELTIGMAFSVFRNIPQAHMAAKQGDFRRSKFVGMELNGKTAGVIGLGRIGSIVASKLKALNMRVVAHDPFITEERVQMLGVEKCQTIEELLEQADLITVHIPKMDKNQDLIGEKELKLCKDGVRIINVARGGIINEKALYNALKEGKVAGAAIDVLEEEPNFTKKPEEQDYTNPLLELDNVIFTPHLGASTEEASHNVSIGVAKLIEKVLKGELVEAVNMPPLKSTDLEELKPYVELAEVLGKIYYQAENETVKKIEVSFKGSLASKETRAISLSVLKGFLEPITRETVNYVNAEFFARDMGVELVEKRSTHLDKYANLITVRFITKNKDLSLSGTVFTKEEIRIVDFFGYKLDFEPTPHVLAVQSADKPGVIGQIGTVLGEAGINIAAMQWSRSKKNGKAVAFISVDSEIDGQIMERIRNINGVLRVSTLNF